MKRILSSLVVLLLVCMPVVASAQWFTNITDYLERVTAELDAECADQLRIAQDKLHIFMNVMEQQVDGLQDELLVMEQELLTYVEENWLESDEFLFVLGVAVGSAITGGVLWITDE
jgi:hypothetical protein